MPMADHSDDQQAALTPRAIVAEMAEVMRHNHLTISACDRYLSRQVARLCLALDPVLATVERLEAAEKSRTVDKPTASPPVAPSPPAADETVVHTFKPVADRDDTDLVNLVEQLHTRAAATNAKPVQHDAWVEARNELLCRLGQLRRDLAEAQADKAEADKSTGSWMRAADFERDAADRLRARLADGVRGKAQHVALGGGVSSAFVVLDRGLPTGTPVLVLPDEPEGEG